MGFEMTRKSKRGPVWPGVRSVMRAYDLVGVSLPAPFRSSVPPVVAPKLRPMSVRSALEWAFGAECVGLDFDEAGGWSVGSDCVWRLMQRKALGCQVDGGGRSPAHPDAEIIASFVAQLPDGCGGRGMAVRVAEMARAGITPDWMRDARPRCVPKAWRNTKHGTFAATEQVGEAVTTSRGRRVVHQLIACPVTYAPSAGQIASARRGWLDWWGALLHLGSELRGAGGLETVEITGEMPPLTPWM